MKAYTPLRIDNDTVRVQMMVNGTILEEDFPLIHEFTDPSVKEAPTMVDPTWVRSKESPSPRMIEVPGWEPPTVLVTFHDLVKVRLDDLDRLLKERAKQQAEEAEKQSAVDVALGVQVIVEP